MREFGSDFHFILPAERTSAHLTEMFVGAALLADGRQCIVALIRQNGWRRIWMPDYFCYEVIETIRKQTGIEVLFYEDNPLTEGNVEALPFLSGDVLLRMNFFGMRAFRSNAGLPVPVVEDHSHDLLGPWAQNSDADWCIASLRKSLPVPEGGMFWSPKGHALPAVSASSEENERVASIRWEGMEMKAGYLRGEDVRKDVFREKFTGTEDWFDQAEPTLLDARSQRYLSGQLDVQVWNNRKRENWQVLKESVLERGCEVLAPEQDSCTMFSLILLMKDNEQRERVRRSLIANSVYPAVLWGLPGTASAKSRFFSERMLSIHCDGRYTSGDMTQLADIINRIIS